MKYFLPSVIASLILLMSSQCAALTIFGVDLGDFGYLESFFSAKTSAGSGSDVCSADDEICERGANVPKSANELGKPRCDHFCLSILYFEFLSLIWSSTKMHQNNWKIFWWRITSFDIINIVYTSNSRLSILL